jgi:hypothetical protein
MAKPKTNKQLLEEIIQRLEILDERVALIEQLVSKLQPPYTMPNLSNLPPPAFFNNESNESYNDIDSFIEFINKFFDEKFGV